MHLIFFIFVLVYLIVKIFLVTFDCFIKWSLNDLPRSFKIKFLKRKTRSFVKWYLFLHTVALNITFIKINFDVRSALNQGWFSAERTSKFILMNVLGSMVMSLVVVFSHLVSFESRIKLCHFLRINEVSFIVLCCHYWHSIILVMIRNRLIGDCCARSGVFGRAHRLILSRRKFRRLHCTDWKGKDWTMIIYQKKKKRFIPFAVVNKFFCLFVYSPFSTYRCFLNGYSILGTRCWFHRYSNGSLSHEVVSN